MTCQYLEKPSECIHVDARTGRQTNCEPPANLRLCTWADNSPEGISALTKAPRWLQRDALSGHQWRLGDCDGCPGYKAR